MPLSGHNDFALLNDVANDAESTQQNDNNVTFASLKSEPTYIKVGKHVTRDATFVTVRAQPYWNMYQYVVVFLLISYKTKVVKASKHFMS